MHARFDVFMTGAGTVGLAAVHRLRPRHPHLTPALAGAEQEPGRYKSSRRSDAPSPAPTVSLSIAGRPASEAAHHLDLGRPEGGRAPGPE